MIREVQVDGLAERPQHEKHVRAFEAVAETHVRLLPLERARLT